MPRPLFSRSHLLPGLLLAGVSIGPAAWAQQSIPRPTTPEAVPSAAPTQGFGDHPEDATHVQMMQKMVKERNALRQKEIVEDTNRLADLAKQLKEAVDKSSKDQLSLDVVNTAAEIERLAKIVKQKMRDGE